VTVPVSQISCIGQDALAMVRDSFKALSLTEAVGP
jgi:hypothetical protein